MSNPFNSSTNKPDRVTDPGQRPSPRPPDFSPAEPWFVSPEKKHKNRKMRNKTFIKKLVSIVLPVIGVAAICIIIVVVIISVMSVYK